MKIKWVRLLALVLASIWLVGPTGLSEAAELSAWLDMPGWDELIEAQEAEEAEVEDVGAFELSGLILEGGDEALDAPVEADDGEAAIPDDGEEPGADAEDSDADGLAEADLEEGDGPEAAVDPEAEEAIEAEDDAPLDEPDDGAEAEPEALDDAAEAVQPGIALNAETLELGAGELFHEAGHVEHGVSARPLQPARESQRVQHQRPVEAVSPLEPAGPGDRHPVAAKRSWQGLHAPGQLPLAGSLAFLGPVLSLRAGLRRVRLLLSRHAIRRHGLGRLPACAVAGKAWPALSQPGVGAEARAMQERCLIIPACRLFRLRFCLPAACGRGGFLLDWSAVRRWGRGVALHAQDLYRQSPCRAKAAGQKKSALGKGRFSCRAEES